MNKQKTDNCITNRLQIGASGVKRMIMNEDAQQSSKEWWSSRRRKYNTGLIIAGVSAFILYAVAGSALIDNFEITLFTVAFQGFAYLIMIGIANVLYNLGYTADKIFNESNNEKFRKRLFHLGYWFSFGLPFLVPLLIIIGYVLGWYK